MKEIISSENCSIKIRPMKLNDVELVYELSSRCFSVPWAKSSLCKELDNNLAYYCVLEYEGDIVGYAGMWLVAGEGEIINIAVDKQYRGKGMGGLILDHLIQIGRQNALLMIHLEVRAGNKAAQSLYTGCGFKQISIRKGYYQKPTEDAVIMIYEYE